MTADNFHDALAEVHSAGYRVQNLFQREAGGWQANLRAEGAKTYSEFGIAATPHGALMAALAGAEVAAPAVRANINTADADIIGPVSEMISDDKPRPVAGLFD